LAFNKYTMLDINDFITEKGGDPKKIKESQRRRYASEEVVDEVIALYEDHRKSRLMEPNIGVEKIG
jgi:seryl-tRNA synthetase